DLNDFSSYAKFLKSLFSVLECESISIKLKTIEFKSYPTDRIFFLKNLNHQSEKLFYDMSV
mgnify:CR=1